MVFRSTGQQPVADCLIDHLVPTSFKMETSAEAKFVSKKINKIRWQPLSSETIGRSNVFATGSWDDVVCINHCPV